MARFNELKNEFQVAETGDSLVLPLHQQPARQPAVPSTRKLRHGEVLVAAGAPILGMVTVVSGRLKRKRVYKAADFLAGILAPQESTGIEEIMHGQAEHRETLQAVGETVVEIHSPEQVQVWLAQMPQAMKAALVGNGPKLRAETIMKRPLELLPVRARVAATLWFLASEHGVERGSGETVRTIDLDLTREEIAHLAGTVYESVIRTLTRLKSEGVIDLNGRLIQILKEDQLARIGQIVVNGEHDQNAISQNHGSSYNSPSAEAF
ncbi:MAG: Crp/Fnr family transcriptional regulator [Bdellovibrionales bacterium]|jgi:CRP-like cAMP-binding protein|nr:Crp/Fnr family transcriptional regulator [Bdellovibrionales bacterium]